MNSYDARCLYEEIKGSGKSLNRWEKDFMKSVELMVSQKCGLTAKQSECLFRIHKKVTE